MRFYAACLASYNNGVLHGQWIDAQSDIDAMQAEVDAMLRASRFPNVTVEHPETGKAVPSAEEWAIHDTEGLPSSIGEYSGLQPIADFVELVEDNDHMDEDDIKAIVQDFGDVETAAERLRNDFCGIYSSFRDYAEEYADEHILSECKNETVARYFDYEAFARDLRMDMNAVEVATGVAIFHA